jgi:hypothetical protein
MFVKGLLTLFLGVVVVGALGLWGGDLPGTQVTAADVLGSETTLALQVLADVFVAVGRAAVDALAGLLDALS